MWKKCGGVYFKMDGLNEEVVRSWDWRSGWLGLGPGSATHWLNGKSLPNLLMHFTLHFDFMLLSVGTKTQCEDFGVEHSGTSSHLRPLSAEIVWRIDDDNNQGV